MADLLKNMTNVTNLLKLRVKLTKVKTQTNSFVAYKVLTKSKKWIDLRFTMAVKNAPTLGKDEDRKEYFIFVKTDNVNYTDAYQYPRFWIRKIERIEEIETKIQDITSFFDEE